MKMQLTILLPRERVEMGQVMVLPCCLGLWLLAPEKVGDLQVQKILPDME